MINTIKKNVKKYINAYQKRICKLEYETQTIRFNERPVELAFVFNALKDIYPEKILDIGSGTTALPHLMRNCGFHVTATDNICDYWPSGMINRHYHIIDDDITNSRLSDKYDFITCISVLEHIVESEKAIRNMIELLNPKGHLIVTFPYSENSYVRNVYELEGSSYGKDLPYITQSYSRAEINRWITDSGCVIANQEYWQFWDGNYWTVGKQVIPPINVSVKDKHQLTCILLQKIN
jgi:2-polyprenyl-3-methyl-5-hydroxy-6-metoxy-1,4-benzoquinol methylase